MRKAWMLALLLAACAPATKGTLSPLHQAVLASGADPHLPDREGESPLDYAARYGYKKAFWILLGK